MTLLYSLFSMGIGTLHLYYLQAYTRYRMYLSLQFVLFRINKYVPFSLKQKSHGHAVRHLAPSYIRDASNATKCPRDMLNKRLGTRTLYCIRQASFMNIPEARFRILGGCYNYIPYRPAFIHNQNSLIQANLAIPKLKPKQPSEISWLSL